MIRKNPIDPKIKNEFLKWVHSNGKILNGLVARRRWESERYFSEL